MKVLVVGGSGFVGTNLCAELSSRGHDVTALSRSPGDAGLPEGVSTAVGDVTAYDSIEEHFEGMDAVVYLVALSPLFKPKGGDEMHERVHLGGAKNVIRAAEEHGVERYVHMSALGADPNANTAYLRTKGEAEQLARDADLETVVFRPSVIFGDGGEFIGFTKLLSPPYLTPLPGGGKMRFQPIWIGDLVPMLADAAEDDEHVGKTYDVGGPEKLTLAEIADRIHTAEGRSTNVIPVPMGLAKIGLSVGEVIPGFPMGRDQYRSLQIDNTTDENAVSAFGVDESDLMTIGQYLDGV
jgi:NADH dehydrogenase